MSPAKKNIEAHQEVIALAEHFKAYKALVRGKQLEGKDLEKKFNTLKQQTEKVLSGHKFVFEKAEKEIEALLKKDNANVSYINGLKSLIKLRDLHKQIESGELLEDPEKLTNIILNLTGLSKKLKLGSNEISQIKRLITYLNKFKENCYFYKNLSDEADKKVYREGLALQALGISVFGTSIAFTLGATAATLGIVGLSAFSGPFFPLAAPILLGIGYTIYKRGVKKTDAIQKKEVSKQTSKLNRIKQKALSKREQQLPQKNRKKIKKIFKTLCANGFDLKQWKTMASTLEDQIKVSGGAVLEKKDNALTVKRNEKTVYQISLLDEQERVVAEFHEQKPKPVDVKDVLKSLSDTNITELDLNAKAVDFVLTVLKESPTFGFDEKSIIPSKATLDMIKKTLSGSQETSQLRPSDRKSLEHFVSIHSNKPSLKKK